MEGPPFLTCKMGTVIAFREGEGGAHRLALQGGLFVTAMKGVPQGLPVDSDFTRRGDFNGGLAALAWRVEGKMGPQSEVSTVELGARAPPCPAQG